MVADVQLKCAGSSTDRDLAAKVALRQDPHQWHLVFSHFFFTNAIPLGFYGGVCEMVHCLHFKWSFLILSFRRRNSNCKIFSLVMYLSMSRYPDMGIFIFFPRIQFCSFRSVAWWYHHGPWMLPPRPLVCLQPTFALIASVNNLYLPPNPIRTNLSFIRWDENRQGPGHVLKSHCNADCKHKDC